MESIRGVLSFVRSAQLGSFTAAAKDLGISAVAVSKNISRLETSLGVRLFQRNTRKLALTPAGADFLKNCEAPLEGLQTAYQAARDQGGDTAGSVRVAAISPFVRDYLVQFLPDFYAKFPSVRLDIELGEELADLLEDQFDVGIRVGPMPDSRYIARQLGGVQVVCVAAPSYLAQYGVPTSLEDLANHQLLGFKRAGLVPSPWLVLENRKPKVLNISSALTVNDLTTLARAAERGLGIAHVPVPVALDALRSGSLKIVLPDSNVPGIYCYLYYPSRKQLPVRVKAFIEFVARTFTKADAFDVNLQPFITRRQPAGKRPARA